MFLLLAPYFDIDNAASACSGTIAFGNVVWFLIIKTFNVNVLSVPSSSLICGLRLASSRRDTILQIMLVLSLLERWHTVNQLLSAYWRQDFAGQKTVSPSHGLLSDLGIWTRCVGQLNTDNGLRRSIEWFCL